MTGLWIKRSVEKSSDIMWNLLHPLIESENIYVLDSLILKICTEDLCIKKNIFRISNYFLCLKMTFLVQIWLKKIEIGKLTDLS